MGQRKKIRRMNLILRIADRHCRQHIYDFDTLELVASKVQFKWADLIIRRGTRAYPAGSGEVPRLFSFDGSHSGT